MSDQDLSSFFALPPSGDKPQPVVSQATSKIEVKGDSVVVEVKDAKPETSEGVRDIIRGAGLDPDLYEVVGYRKSEWTMPNGEPGVSERYSFGPARTSGLDLQYDAELREASSRAVATRGRSLADVGRMADVSNGFVLAIGDLQLGKMENNGTEVEVAIDAVNEAFHRLDKLRDNGQEFTHIHIAWLGDHIEGFESQDGKNAWRTPMGLTEQLRAMRRIMFFTVQEFSALGIPMTVAAVPGNHGRISARGGMTRFNDNFDTDCLVAVADACAQNPDAFGHVQFFVPEADEMTVITDVAGTKIAHAHGHQWPANKHFEWWQGQSFGGRLAGCDVLVAGHLHHLKIDTWGKQMFIQTPSLELESTWYRHRKGTPGSPGVVTFTTHDGSVHDIELIEVEPSAE